MIDTTMVRVRVRGGRRDGGCQRIQSLTKLADDVLGYFSVAADSKSGDLNDEPDETRNAVFTTSSRNMR